MPPPRIGLTTYARNDADWFRLPAQYVDSIRRAGGIPLLVAPGEPHLADALAVCDALVLTGGGDLDPAHYEGTAGAALYDVDADRDRDELALARWVVQRDLPALCICRGLQVLNVALGGTLWSHLPDDVPDAIAHRTPEAKPIPHPVEVEAGSTLARLLGTRRSSPASWHHQAVAAVAPELQVVARAPDGVIEALELAGRPDLIAVQWHPELTSHEDPRQQGLFVALVEAARRRGGVA